MSDLNRAFLENLTRDLSQQGIYRVGSKEAAALKGTSTARLRRGRRSRIDDVVGFMTLVEDDGVFRWELAGGVAPARRAGRRGRPRRTMAQFQFEDLPPNLVTERLSSLDASLTPKQGLHRVTRQTLADLKARRALAEVRMEENVTPVGAGRALLFVHGTFSNCQSVLADIASTQSGVRFLEKCLESGSQYQEVLVFNHPTLSVSPVLNAAVLAGHFRRSKGAVDVICHSRGGLVTRWWLEAIDSTGAGARGHAIFLGSPLAGTGLAAPYRLKAALDVLTSIGTTVELIATAAGAVLPLAAGFGHAAAVLFSLFGKVITFASRTPVLDAAVGLVPGLAAQQRVGSNAEILQLRRSLAGMGQSERDAYLRRNYFVRSNFVPEDPGWRFWRHFRKDQLLNRAADGIFEGDNDLVVDTASMTDLWSSNGGTPMNLLDYGASTDVHHCNYFAQPRTIEFIEGSLGLVGRRGGR